MTLKHPDILTRRPRRVETHVAKPYENGENTDFLRPLLAQENIQRPEDQLVCVR
jgi:hypothetical protein